MTDEEYINNSDLGKDIYQKAKELGIILSSEERWEKGISHHIKSVKLMSFISELDYNDNNDRFCWKCGGDGDNGEELMYLLDVFFELQDKLNIKDFL